MPPVRPSGQTSSIKHGRRSMTPTSKQQKDQQVTTADHNMYPESDTFTQCATEFIALDIRIAEELSKQNDSPPMVQPRDLSTLVHTVVLRPHHYEEIANADDITIGRTRLLCQQISSLSSSTPSRGSLIVCRR